MQGASDSNTPALIEMVPLVDVDWGPVREEDKWCYLCEFMEAPSDQEGNHYYSLLMQLLENKNSMSEMLKCKTIQKSFNDNFKMSMKVPREWTLRSIRNHANNGGQTSENARTRDILSTIFICIKEVEDRMLMAVDCETNTRFITQGGIKMLNQIVSLRSKVLRDLR